MACIASILAQVGFAVIVVGILLWGHLPPDSSQFFHIGFGSKNQRALFFNVRKFLVSIYGLYGSVLPRVWSLDHSSGHFLCQTSN